MDGRDPHGKHQKRLEERVQQLRSRLQIVRPSHDRPDEDGRPATESVKAYQPGKYPTIAESLGRQGQSSVKSKARGKEPVEASEQEDAPSDFEDFTTISSRGHAGPTSEQQNDVGWQPSLVIGSSSIDAGNPSIKEVARRNMLQWEHIYQHHRKQTSEDFQLEVLDERRKDARREYENICARADPEDDVPRNETQAFKKERVQSRLAVLHEALAQSTEPECEPMRTNISAAIRGYQEGTIECSSTYTLIFAGHIVDTTCRTWAEFTVDRKDRLDRYFKQHGPGFLWWEPPLASGRDNLNAKKALFLDVTRHNDPDVQFRDDQCHFRVPMCFRKDSALTCRMDEDRAHFSNAGQGNTKKLSAMKRKWVLVDDGESDTELLKKARDKVGDAYDPRSLPSSRNEKAAKGAILSKAELGPELFSKNASTARVRAEATAGQTHFFEMLLDSGCETPILYHEDLVSLGFRTADMNAATVATIHGANGRTSKLKIFEILAGVQLDEDDPHNQDLFPTCVVKLDWKLKPPSGYSGERLSGLFPFLAYYMSFAPGMDRAYMGDERGDILGMQRIPGGLRYDPFMKPQLGEPRETLFKRLLAKNPSKIVFEHQVQIGGRKLIEEEIDSEGARGTSRVTLFRPDGTIIETCKIENHHDKRRRKLTEYVE
ncbi:hypothetical protein N8I77_012951 [Diaporthe amygdali]|uniref:Uncharacterized protein n=1 Tax=Phomopsis amygdali TaxID=1214568 RepID=A0AAD9VZ88_PHOAM|nr:hypothetical protein N8I77_012951 [Diaporthe amygdali]